MLPSMCLMISRLSSSGFPLTRPLLTSRGAPTSSVRRLRSPEKYAAVCAEQNGYSPETFPTERESIAADFQKIAEDPIIDKRLGDTGQIMSARTTPLSFYGRVRSPCERQSMRRRDLITLMVWGAAFPLAARAQRPALCPAPRTLAAGLRRSTLREHKCFH